MKLFSLEKLVQITYHIHLSNLTRLTFLNAPIKSTQELFQIQNSTSMLMQIKKLKSPNRIIGLIRRLSATLPRNALLTIYKTFVRPYLDYGDILYDKPNNEIFRRHQRKFSIEPAMQQLVQFTELQEQNPTINSVYIH